MEYTYIVKTTIERYDNTKIEDDAENLDAVQSKTFEVSFSNTLNPQGINLLF